MCNEVAACLRGRTVCFWMAGSAYVYANPVLMDHRPTISGRPNPRWVMRRISSNAVSWFGALIRSRQKVRPLLTIALRLAPTMPAEVSWVSARLAFSWLVKLATCTRMLSRAVVAVTWEVCAEFVRVSLVASLGGVGFGGICGCNGRRFRLPGCDGCWRSYWSKSSNQGGIGW